MFSHAAFLFTTIALLLSFRAFEVLTTSKYCSNNLFGTLDASCCGHCAGLNPLALTPDRAGTEDDRGGGKGWGKVRGVADRCI